MLLMLRMLAEEEVEDAEDAEDTQLSAYARCNLNAALTLDQ